MQELKREYKFFMGGFFSGFLFYVSVFILGFYIRIKGILLGSASIDLDVVL